MKVTVSVTFNDENERDRELLRRLRAEANRSATVRQALEEHYGLVTTLRDLVRRLEELRDLAESVAAPRPGGPAADEPADLAAALDQLGTQ